MVWRLLLGAAVASAMIPVLPAGAQTAGVRQVDCELTVDGKTRIKGPCEFRPTGGGGFQISGGDHFAYLSVVRPGVGEASWNGKPGSSHAHVPLGRLRRDGACWIGTRARICARALSPARRQAVQAAQPRGVMLYPEVASQSCLGTSGPVKAGQAIMLRDCRSPRDKIFTVGRDGTIGLDRQPNLCLDLKSSGISRPPELILAQCTSGGPRWKIAANGPSVIRSTDGRCLTIPQIDLPAAKFPFAVRASACAKAQSRAVRFLIERE